MLRKSMGPIVTACLVLSACRDNSDPIPTSPIAVRNEAEGRGFAQRLFAIGTSISAGTCSDGNVAACQNMSWIAQLERAMHREPILPLIAAPGCKAPFAPPLISFRRTSGESVTVPEAAVLCSANEPGVVLPTQNLAVPGALTGEALAQTPAGRTDPFGSQLYRRILPLDKSQVSALEALDPKFVTVELGANDIFGTFSGVVIPGGSFVPFNVWAAQYNTVLDRVGAVTNLALLVGLGRDISKLPNMRRGSELYADRAAFLSAFNVDVSANCDGSTNLVVVNVVVPTAVANGLGRRAAGLPPFTLSCAGGAFNVQDRILGQRRRQRSHAAPPMARGPVPHAPFGQDTAAHYRRQRALGRSVLSHAAALCASACVGRASHDRRRLQSAGGRGRVTGSRSHEGGGRHAGIGSADARATHRGRHL